LISPPWRMLTLTRGSDAHRQLLARERKGFKDEDFIDIAYKAFKDGSRRGPMLPDDFDKCLDTLTFTNGTDRDTVKPKYRQAFNILVEGASMLSFRGFNMTREAATKALELVLARCPNMEELDMAENQKWDADTNSLVERVAAAPCSSKLTRLDFTSCWNLHGEVRCFSGLPNLQTLILALCRQVRGDLQGLAPLVQLRHLNLSMTRVSGDVKALATLVRLQHLELNFTRVSGDVKGFAPLVRLDRLHLNNTGVSGNARAFALLVNLRHLNIWNTKVTGNFKALRRRLPELMLQCDEESNAPRRPGETQRCACTIA